MRGDQLAALVGPHLPDDLRIRVLPFHAGMLPPLAMRAFALAIPVGAIVVFVKSAAKGLTQDHLAALRSRDARIGLDSIDTPLDQIDFDLFDFQIAASLAGQSALSERLAQLGKRGVPVELLHHHHDPRLAAIERPVDRPFRCGYVGAPGNALIPPGITYDVERIDVRYTRDFTRSLRRIAGLTLHYGVRPMPAPTASISREYKPFTKGFTAAACASNILVNREADDAVALLGEDYPFLVSATNLDSVVDGLVRAKQASPGPLWNEGLDRMRALRELVAPVTLATRLREIVDVVAP
ncbi:MAG: hypothetical protein NXH83_10210 [Rhodobacteraceae bacterium]|nr:hypothetical protein [Paracoccaceae bacterium]